VQRDGPFPEDAEVEVLVAGQHGAQRLGDRAIRRQQGEPIGLPEAMLHGHVHADHHDRPRRVEHQPRRLRIVEDVRLGDRRDVPRHQRRAGHQHHRLDQADDLGSLPDGEGQVGQRPDAHNP
jgi:hypothetical protein